LSGIRAIVASFVSVVGDVLLESDN